MRPGCYGPKWHSDMHANFSFLLQPYRPSLSAAEPLTVKQCCWERMVLCHHQLPPARGCVPGPPAMAGFPAVDVLGGALTEGWLQTSLPGPPQEAEARATFPAQWQQLSLQTAALQMPKAKCTKMLLNDVLKSCGLAPASFLGAYSPASSAFIAPHKKH